MCHPYIRSNAVFRSLCSPLGFVFCLTISALLVGSIAIPALADEQLNLRNEYRWAKHPALQPFDVAGKTLPSELYFVRTRGDLPDVDGVVSYGKHKDVFLVSGDEDVVLGLARLGCAVIPIKDLQPREQRAEREWTWISTPDPHIEEMVAQVEWPGVIDKIQSLVDFDTRYCLAANHREVAESLRDAFASYGLQVTMRQFSFGGPPMWNVEATQVGTLYPNSYVIICGHFDSISEDPMNLAPGADDNATGTAAVLTAAEILSQYSFEYSIRYICFSAEELGLVGSYFYAAEERWKNTDIVGALNFDMLGYWEPGVEKDLEIETDHASMWLAQAVVNAADLYTGTPYELHVYDWAWWGDHFRFWMMGYSAVNHEESWDWYDPDFNPYYHSVNDLPAYVDPDFTVGNIKVGVAALATLATAEPPRPVTFDVRPGSCPNPLNPKSNGVVPALLLGSEEFDVRHINLSSLRLEDTVSPIAARVADMGSAYDGTGHPCADTSPDGYADLSMKFSTEDIASVLGKAKKGDEVSLLLRGRLFDGTVIEGQDVVVIVGNTGGPVTADDSFSEPPANIKTLAQEPGMPAEFALYQNVPNPFNPTTSIRFDVPAGGGLVTLRVYDVSGRLVRTLVNGAQTAGLKTVEWNGTNDAGNSVATGTYLYRLTGPGFEQTRKMLMLK